MKKNGKSKKAGAESLSAEQKLFVDYIADPDNSETPGEFSKRIGVPVRTLMKWKADPLIVQTAVQQCVTRMGSEMPKVLKMLLEKSLHDKDIVACKLFLKHIDSFSDMPETGMSVDDVLAIVNGAVRQQEKKDDNAE